MDEEMRVRVLECPDCGGDKFNLGFSEDGLLVSMCVDDECGAVILCDSGDAPEDSIHDERPTFH